MSLSKPIRTRLAAPVVEYTAKGIDFDPSDESSIDASDFDDVKSDDDVENDDDVVSVRSVGTDPMTDYESSDDEADDEPTESDKQKDAEQDDKEPTEADGESTEAVEQKGDEPIKNDEVTDTASIKSDWSDDLERERLEEPEFEKANNQLPVRTARRVFTNRSNAPTFTCECGLMCKSGRGLATHKKSCKWKPGTSERLVYDCEKCNRQYKTRRGFINHGKKCDSSEPSRGPATKPKTSVKRIKRPQPTDETTCTDCSRTFTTRAGLNTHKRFCNNDVRFVCDTCDKVYKTKRGHDAHVCRLVRIDKLIN